MKKNSIGHNNKKISMRLLINMPSPCFTFHTLKISIKRVKGKIKPNYAIHFK